MKYLCVRAANVICVQLFHRDRIAGQQFTQAKPAHQTAIRSLHKFGPGPRRRKRGDRFVAGDEGCFGMFFQLLQQLCLGAQGFIDQRGVAFGRVREIEAKIDLISPRIQRRCDCAFHFREAGKSFEQ
jgi:hypothetical protein